MAKQMLKRKDGSVSQRGMWDNIRENKGSGKKPTAEMLKQGAAIKKKATKSKVPKGSHIMPDGRIMKDSAHKKKK